MIGIFCGRGDYPNIIIDACQKQKKDFCLLFINYYDRTLNYPDVPKIVFRLGEVKKVLQFLKINEVDKIIFAGYVKRPGFFDLSLDFEGFKWLLKLWKVLFHAGDDALLRGIENLFKEEGFELIAGTDLLKGTFFSEGVFSERKPTKEEEEEIQQGIRESQMLGIQDIGQSIVVSGDSVIAKEDRSGTDALIDRCFEGILIKTSKPQQDLRMDLPVIGVKTIENLHHHNFRGLVIEADRTIVLNPKEVLKKVDKYGLFFKAVKIRKNRKVFIVAGESSGDYLGGRLIKDLKKLDDDIEFVGIGGPCMEEAGLINLCPISRLSLIGIWEILGKIFYIKELINKTVSTIMNYKPDVLVTIDSSGFTHRIDRRVKKRCPGLPVVHYVSPPVWAWRGWRAKNLHEFIDKLMVLFPFEEKFFKDYEINTTFVGHPIASDEDMVRDKNLQSKNLTITLLPGSRPSELERHMPILKKFSELMIEKHPEVRFYLPTVKTVAPLIKKYVADWHYKPTVSTKKMKKVKAFNLSHVAVAASGTVTLELAKMKLPFVTIYKTSLVTYKLVKWLIKIPYVCLVNILAEKPIIPELLQDECTPQNICDAVEDLLNTEKKDRQKDSFEKIMKELKVERMKAAREVYSFIKNKKKK